MRSGPARALIAEKLDDLNYDFMRLIGLDEPAEIRRNSEAPGSHLSANQNVESGIKRSMDELRSRHQSEVLRFVMGAVLNASCDSDVELTRQIRELRVAFFTHNRPVKSKNNRGGIQQFVGS